MCVSVRTTHRSKKKMCLLLISGGLNEQKWYGGQGCYDGINLYKNRNGLSHISQIMKKKSVLQVPITVKKPNWIWGWVILNGFYFLLLERKEGSFAISACAEGSVPLGEERCSQPAIWFLSSIGLFEIDFFFLETEVNENKNLQYTSRTSSLNRYLWYGDFPLNPLIFCL